MALISCPECAKQISSAAANCPDRGHPMFAHPTNSVGAQPTVQPKWNPGMAAVLSLVIPGAGQMYKGQVWNGIVWLIFVVIGYAAFVVPGLFLHLFCIIVAASGDPCK